MRPSSDPGTAGGGAGGPWTRGQDAFDAEATEGFGPGGRRPPPGAVLLVPVVLSLVLQVVGTLLQLGGARAWMDRPGVVLVALGFAVAGPLLLLAARRAPGPVAALVLAVAVADVLIDPAVVAPFVAPALAIVLGVARGARVWVFSAVASAWIAGFGGLALLGIDWRPGRIVLTTAGLIIALGAGEFLRTRRLRWQQRSLDRRRRREDAVAAERVRIARELHDVLAHSLSQISVQAGVGLHLLDSDPQQARSALESIRGTSRTALDEVRSVLGVLRDEERPDPRRPQPGLAALPDLVASTGSPALVTRFEGDTDLRLAGPAQFALYRIAQEALTNVVRHSGASNVLVRLHDDPDAVVLSISDDGRGVGSAEPGRGVLGMRERAELLGGTLDVASAPAGVTVTATIPKEQT